jgi:hypothetical protein
VQIFDSGEIKTGFYRIPLFKQISESTECVYHNLLVIVHTKALCKMQVLHSLL